MMNASSLQSQEKFFENIRRQYSNSLCRKMKKFTKKYRKLASLIQHRNFLLDCRKYGFIPNFIKHVCINTLKLFSDNTNSRICSQLGKYLEDFKYKILNLYIKNKCDEIANLKKFVQCERVSITSSLNTESSVSFFDVQERVFQLVSVKDKVKLTRKFQALKTETFKNYNIITGNKSFINLTDREIPLEIGWMLSLGKKFAVNLNLTNKNDILKVISDVECLAKTLQDESRQNLVRSKLSNLIYSHIKCKKCSGLDILLNRIYSETANFLKSNRDLLILTADKGGATVVMMKQNYKTKMNLLVHDSSTYEQINSDPTSKIQTKNNKIVKYFFDRKWITPNEKNKLTVYNATSPRIYGLPKIHKDNIPIRPIVSFIGSPVYSLSQYFAEILKVLTVDSPFNIKNSFEFRNKISNIVLNPNEIFVSFDVVSLFSNISVELFLEIIKEEWNKLKEHTVMSKTKFIEALKFCLKEANYFSYDNSFFRQIFGVPMGSPLSPISADIVMTKCLNNFQQKFLSSIGVAPKILLKYVDDLFAILPNNCIDSALSILNDFNQHIKFTCEIEENNTLSYLDLLVIKSDDRKIITNWYQKEVSCGRILNFNSSHPYFQKINTAKNFISRVLDLSDPRFHRANILKINKILTFNNYPYKLIKRLVNNKIYNQAPSNQVTLVNSGDNFYKGISYIKGLSEKFGNIMKEYNPNLKIGYKAVNTLEKIFGKLKDSIPKEQKSNVVYKIPCKGSDNEACSLSYVGTTSQLLKNRISQHLSDIRCRKETTALSSHCILLNHSPDIRATEILTCESNYKKRLVLEALHIYTQNYTMNKKSDVDNVSVIYSAILN